MLHSFKIGILGFLSCLGFAGGTVIGVSNWFALNQSWIMEKVGKPSKSAVTPKTKGFKGLLIFIPKFYSIIVPMSTLMKSI